MKKKISKKVVWVLVPVLAVGVLLGGRAAVSAADRQEAELKAKSYVPEDAVLQGKETDDGMYKFTYYAESTRTEYEVEIRRSSGEIRELETELLGGRGSQSAALTEEQVAARTQELYPGAEISGLQLGEDDGLYSYEVYFRAEDKYGSLELNAEDGTLLESKVKFGTPVVIPAETSNVTADTSYLGEEAIRSQVAAAYPGSQMIEVEMDREDGRYVYEVEFFTDGWKYDLALDALTGETLKEEREQTNWRPSETAAASETAAETAAQETAAAAETEAPAEISGGQTPQGQESQGQASQGQTSSGQTGTVGQEPLGEAQAMEIALGKAGSEHPEVDWSGSITELHLDRDDGRLLYEGEMRSGAVQCEFEIDAYTGVVLKWETEVKGNSQNGQSAGTGAETIGTEAASSIALGKPRRPIPGLRRWSWMRTTAGCSTRERCGTTPTSTILRSTPTPVR